jgi:hypothetical protein
MACTDSAVGTVVVADMEVQVVVVAADNVEAAEWALRAFVGPEQLKKLIIIWNNCN